MEKLKKTRKVAQKNQKEIKRAHMGAYYRMGQLGRLREQKIQSDQKTGPSAHRSSTKHGLLALSSEGHEYYDYRVVLNLKSMGWAVGPTGQFSLGASKDILDLKSMGWVAEPVSQFLFRTKHKHWISRGNYVITNHSRSSRAPYRKSGSRKTPY